MDHDVTLTFGTGTQGCPTGTVSDPATRGNFARADNIGTDMDPANRPKGPLASLLADRGDATDATDLVVRSCP